MRRLARPVVAAALTAAALLAGGCGADDDAGGQIDMRELQFQPRTTTVRVGQRVEWRNDEDAPHNVVATASVGPRSQTIARDDTFAFTPSRSGTIHYVCTLHPGMTGTLRVLG